MSQDVYQALGIRRVINGMGNVTLLGGSSLSPKVQAAMEQANRYFAPMEEVLDQTGQSLAGMMGAERAFVTSGCFAALVLGVAALLTGGDPEKVARLPDTTGMKNEILLQAGMRYHYDRCISVPGGKLVEVGDQQGTTAKQLAAAIGPQCAGVFYFARMEGKPGLLSLDEVVRIAHEHGVPVIVDAAAELYPVQLMHNRVASGADLLCFGAKYLGAQNSAGILCGRADWVQAARLNNFTSYETHKNRAIGRGYKIDRQEVIGVTVAMSEWLSMDHEERLQRDAERVETIQNALAGLPHVQSDLQWNSQREPWMRLMVHFDEARVGKNVQAVIEELRSGEPSIWLRNDGNDLNIMVNALADGEAEVVGARLREVLTGAGEQ
jgi:L-seryl-tRNA(Ser) seleniumtransferase